ncbi:hypothetical protein CF319_g6510 [Tilletia indica]|nr:hypothetical protein CF319_g6510 [Tilletia indica]
MSSSSSASKGVSRPLGVVERLQVTMENLGVGSVFHLGARLLHPHNSDQDFIDHFQRRVQLMLDEIPVLSNRVELREPQPAEQTKGKDGKGKAKFEPHMVCDMPTPFLASQIANTSITAVPLPSSSSRGGIWDTIRPLAAQSSQQRIHIRGGPLWSVDFFQTPSLNSDEEHAEDQAPADGKLHHHQRTVYVFLSCSHALVDGRGSRNIMDALISTEPLLLSSLDIQPIYPPFEETGLTKMNMTVLWDMISTALVVLLPFFLKNLFGVSEVWPNHFKPATFKMNQAEGIPRTRSMVLSRDQVRALKAAASKTGSAGRCTLHSTINQVMKVAVIAADRAYQRTAEKDTLPALPNRLRYHFASQNPIDMRTGDPLRSYGRFAGNNFGMKVVPVSSRTDVRFWTEAITFNRSICSPATRKAAAATLSILSLIPTKEGWVDEDGARPELYTGWEGFFRLAFQQPANFSGTCNYSNLGLVAQPRASVDVQAKAALEPAQLAIIVPQRVIVEKSMDILKDSFLTPTGGPESNSKQLKLMDTMTPPLSPQTTFAEMETAKAAAGTSWKSGMSSPDSSAVPKSGALTPDVISNRAGSAASQSQSALASAALPTSASDQVLPTFLVEEVFFTQSPQPGSCAFFVNVAGCALAPLSTTSSTGHSKEAAAGGTVTLSVTSFQGHLPDACTDTFVEALQSGLALCASGAIGPETTVAQAVLEVERALEGEKMIHL